MKNIKNIVAAVMLMTVLMVGTTFAEGIIVSDLAGTANQNVCTQVEREGIVLGDRGGMLMSDLVAPTNQNNCDQGSKISIITGIIVAGLTGIIVSD